MKKVKEKLNSVKVCPPPHTSVVLKDPSKSPVSRLSQCMYALIKFSDKDYTTKSMCTIL